MRDRKSAIAQNSRTAIRACWCLAAAIVVVWAVSLFLGPLVVHGNTKRFTLQLADGIVAASWPSAPQATAPSVIVHLHDTFYLKPRSIVGPRSFGLILPFFGISAPISVRVVSFVFIPLWLPLLLTLLVILILVVRNRRRIPVGHCTRCRYDLTGNTSGVCPECGMPLPSTAADQPREGTAV